MLMAIVRIGILIEALRSQKIQGVPYDMYNSGGSSSENRLPYLAFQIIQYA